MERPRLVNHLLNRGIAVAKLKSAKHPSDMDVCRNVDRVMVGKWYLEISRKNVGRHGCDLRADAFELKKPIDDLRACGVSCPDTRGVAIILFADSLNRLPKQVAHNVSVAVQRSRLRHQAFYIRR